MSATKKNIIYQIGYQILTILIPLITSPYVARVLGANGIGIYSYTYSIVSYFALFAKMGIHVYGNRTIARVRDEQQKLNQTFSDLLAVHISVSVIAICAYIGYLMYAQPEYMEIAVIQVFYVVAEMVEINWLYFGLEKFKITVTANSIIKVGTLAATFLFVRDKDDVWKYCVIMACGAFLSELFMWIFRPKYVKIVRPDFNNAKKHIMPLIGFFIPSIAVSLYKVMDKIMLGVMADTVQVGYYENSEKIIAVALGFITAVGSVMMPRMSNLAVKGSEEQEKEIIAYSMKIVIISVVAMAGGIMGVADVFVPVYWGEDFEDCKILLKALAISLLFTAFANVIRTQYLLPKQRDNIFRGSVITGACVNLVINFFLIPRYHAFGAAMGTIAAEGSVCLIQSVYVSKFLPITDYLRKSVPYILFSLIMSVVVYGIGLFMGSSIMTLLIQLFAGIIIFAILTGVYWFKTSDELWESIIIIVHKFRKTA